MQIPFNHIYTYCIQEGGQDGQQSKREIATEGTALGGKNQSGCSGQTRYNTKDIPAGNLKSEERNTQQQSEKRCEGIQDTCQRTGNSCLSFSKKEGREKISKQANQEDQPPFIA